MGKDNPLAPFVKGEWRGWISASAGVTLAAVVAAVFLCLVGEVRADSLKVTMAGRNWDVHLKAGVYSGYTGSTDYAGKMGTESSQHYHHYLYFDNVTLASGVVVDSVFIWVRAYAETDPTNVQLRTWCEDTADASLYPNTTSDIASRTKTTAYVDFTPSAWGTSDRKLGGNLATPTQEVLDRGDWASGNALAYFVENVHSLGTDQLIFSRTYDYFADGGGTPAPYLIIYYHTVAADSDYRRRRMMGMMGMEYNPLAPFAKGEFCKWEAEW